MGKAVGAGQPLFPARAARHSPEPPASSAGPKWVSPCCQEHPPRTLRAFPHPVAATPAQPPAPPGDQRIAPALPSFPLNLLSCLPKATWSHAAIPKMHRGRGGGRGGGETHQHEPTPALSAVLPYTAIHAQRPPRHRGAAQALPSSPGSSPNKYPVTGTSCSPGAPVWCGVGAAPQSGSSCSSSSSFRPLVATMWSSCFMYRSRSCMKWGMRAFSRTPNFFRRFTSS